MNRALFVVPFRLSPILVLALVTLLGGGHAALAQTCGGGTVDPGDSFCLQPVSCSTSIQASGSSMKEVSFSVGDTVGTTHKVLFSNTGSTGFLESWNSTDNPKDFPGTFEICAMRGSGHTDAATVQLCYICD